MFFFKFRVFDFAISDFEYMITRCFSSINDITNEGRMRDIKLASETLYLQFRCRNRQWNIKVPNLCGSLPVSHMKEGGTKIHVFLEISKLFKRTLKEIFITLLPFFFEYFVSSKTLRYWLYYAFINSGHHFISSCSLNLMKSPITTFCCSFKCQFFLLVYFELSCEHVTCTDVHIS